MKHQNVSKHYDQDFIVFIGIPKKNWALDAWSGRLDSGRLGSEHLDAWTLDAWTLDAWMLRLWTLGLSTLGHLDFGRLDSGRLDIWTLGNWTLHPWTQKILSIFSDIYFFLIIIYCRIFKHFEHCMTNLLALLKLL